MTLYHQQQRWDDVCRVTEESRGGTDLGAQALVFRARALAARGEPEAALAALKERCARRPADP